MMTKIQLFCAPRLKKHKISIGFIDRPFFLSLTNPIFTNMKYKLIVLLLLPALAGFTQTDKKLTAKLQDAISGFNGQVGIYVQNLKTGKTVTINADTLFPTASMIKVSIQCGLMDKIEKGELQYNQKLVYRDSLLYAGEDILGSFKDKDTIQLSKVAMLMITMSDNTASLWLQKLVDGAYINNWLDQNGFKVMRVNSRVADRKAFQKRYGWGVSTPYEMCRLLTMINGGEALSQIPPYVHTISKQGAVNESRSETVLVNAPHGDFVFSIITNHIKDQRWTTDNEAGLLIQKVAALLWHYYEPGSKWKPADGMAKYMTNE
jgi:beta-lactamase class A